jgi:autotransporter-associated beta strand protein
MFSLSGNLTVRSDVTTTQTFKSSTSFRLLRNDTQRQIITNNGTGQLIIESGVVSNVTRAIAVFDGRGDIQVGKLLARLSSHNLDIVKQGTGTLTIVGAETVAPGSGWIGYSCGTTTILGGTLAINNEANLGANPSTASDDALLLDGGTLKATATFAIDDSGRGVTVGPAGGTFEVDSSKTLTIANVIAGTGALSKSGSGTLTLTAANLYSGTTHVQTGPLVLSGSGSIANSSAISVAAGATLDIIGASGGQYALASGQTLTGGGSVLGNLVVADGATISAGNSPGKLTITGSYDQNGTMLVDLWGENQGTASGYDWIDVAGTAQLQGLLKPVFDNGFLPQTGDAFRILTANSITIDGNLQIDSSAASLAPAQYWKYTIVDISAGRQALELSVAVPEPATLSLLLILMPLGLLAGRRLIG